MSPASFRGILAPSIGAALSIGACGALPAAHPTPCTRRAPTRSTAARRRRPGGTFEASATNTSGVLVLNCGTLTLTDVAVTTSGSSSSSDASSLYGLDAGVLAKSGSTPPP